MKNLRLTILTVVLLAAMALSASAQTKIATVDMKKLFNGYWKTKQATASLENRKGELRKELKDMADGIDKAQAQYKQLLDQASDPAISLEERDKRNAAAQAKGKEINSSKAAFEQFQRQADTQLADESQRMSSKLVADIQKTVADRAKIMGFSIVVNSADAEAIVYSSSDTDITDTVLAQLNIGSPVDLTKPVSGTTFTTSTNRP